MLKKIYPLFLFLLILGCVPSAKKCPPFEQTKIEGFSQESNFPFQFPINDEYIFTQPFLTEFAKQAYVLQGELKYHAAEDYLMPAGTPVYAMADGIISYSGAMDGYGLLIIIDHPQANLYSLYGHLSPSRWHAGRGEINKGELIAYLGDSSENGSSKKYGEMVPHLHFGVRSGQRKDYPGHGEWRWQAGWIKICPQETGWLQPSLVITEQIIPSGGFKNPEVRWFSLWGVEFLLIGFVLIWMTVILISQKSKKNYWILFINGLLLLIYSWFCYQKLIMIYPILTGIGLSLIITASIWIFRSRSAK